MGEVRPDATRDSDCPSCGSTPQERRLRDDYQGLRACHYCDAPKCCLCDMGDDVNCGACPDGDT